MREQFVEFKINCAQTRGTHVRELVVFLVFVRKPGPPDDTFCTASDCFLARLSILYARVTRIRRLVYEHRFVRTLSCIFRFIVESFAHVLKTARVHNTNKLSVECTATFTYGGGELKLYTRNGTDNLQLMVRK